MDLKLLFGTFLEGLLSFVSPCVLPLIPLYMSYLSADAREEDEEGNVTYKTGKVFITTLFFIAGICLTFFLLAVSLETFRTFLDRYREVISIIGGTLMIVFGLHEVGLIHIDLLDKDFRFRPDLHLEKMNYFKAFLLGFVFSLGWSPCIGPLLANALLLAATSAEGYLYIVAYSLGLVIPFLITGLFTSKVLQLIREKKQLFANVLRIAGIIMIIFGVYMIMDASKSIASIKTIEESSSVTDEKEDLEKYLYELELKDIDGNTVRLSDYKGKYIFMNFATTWCTYCEAERPEFAKFAENSDVQCLFVMSPGEEQNGMSDIEEYLKTHESSVKTLIDENGTMFYYCSVRSFPTTFVIDPDGDFLTYINGAMTANSFSKLYEYVKSGMSE